MRFLQLEKRLIAINLDQISILRIDPGVKCTIEIHLINGERFYHVESTPEEALKTYNEIIQQLEQI